MLPYRHLHPSWQGRILQADEIVPLPKLQNRYIEFPRRLKLKSLCLPAPVYSKTLPLN